MTKRFKIAVAVVALAAMSSPTAALAGGRNTCGSIWNLLVLAKKCP